MARTGFLPASQVERILAFAPLEAKEIALELRNIVATACPHATESVLWGALSYHDCSKGGRVKGAICAVDFRKQPVTLSFIHGARLADPDKLLKGMRLSKRYLVISSFKEAPWDAIRMLVEQAAALDPNTFAPIKRGPGRRQR